MVFTPRILLYRGTGLLGRLIRWQTRGRYAHAAILANPDEVIEAVAGAGVRCRHADDLTQADQFIVPRMTEQQWIDAIAFCRFQVGKPYDYGGILRFLSRRPESLLRWADSWFCSELVAAACMASGFPLFNKHPWEIPPSLLPASREMHPVPGSMAFARQSTVATGDPRINAFIWARGIAA